MLKNATCTPATCRLLLLLICLLTQTVLSAQARFTNQQVFGVEDGLPQSYISGITQDKDGFLWVKHTGRPKQVRWPQIQTLQASSKRQYRDFRAMPSILSSLSITINCVLMYDGLSGDRFNMRTFRSQGLAKVNDLRNHFQCFLGYQPDP